MAQDRTKFRCPVCRMDEALCICCFMRVIKTNTQVELLIHQKEYPKSSNTGHLAEKMLSQSQMTLRSKKSHSIQFVERILSQEHLPMLLFPNENARSLDEVLKNSSPETPKSLVIVDGTWHQAQEIIENELKGLHAFAVQFPRQFSKIPQSDLWDEPISGGLATIEAILWALQILEAQNPHLQFLERLIKIRADRIKWVRHWISEEEVFGGIPAAAKLKKILAG